jgi:creatinine amidohydrolase
MRLFAEMTRADLGAAAPGSLAILPIGATEQHGPHLPTGTDLFAVEAVAHAAATIASARIPVIVTPTLPFGSSEHHFVFGATLSIGSETYYRVLRDLLTSLVRDGFTKIFVVNGHGGNHELAELAARDTALAHPVQIAAGSYWAIAWEALTQAGAHESRRLPGHAGDFETSLMLRLRPELPSRDLPRREGTFCSDPRDFKAPWRTEVHGSWKEIDGYTDSPANASAESGGKFFELITDAVAQAFVRFYDSQAFS